MSDLLHSEPPLEIVILPPTLRTETVEENPSRDIGVEKGSPIVEMRRPKGRLRVLHLALLLIPAGFLLWTVDRSRAVNPAEGSRDSSAQQPPAPEPSTLAGIVTSLPGRPAPAEETVFRFEAPAPIRPAPEVQPTPALSNPPPAPGATLEFDRIAPAPIPAPAAPAFVGPLAEEAFPAAPAEVLAAPAPEKTPPPPEPEPPGRAIEREVESAVSEARLLEGDQPAQAAALYRKALALNSSKTDLWKMVADLDLRRGAPQDAALAYREFLHSHPDRADALQNLGILELHQGRVDEARKCLEDALRLTPSADLHYNLGNLHLGRGALDPAGAAYRRALELTPGHREARFNLALVLEREGKLTEAIGILVPLGTVSPEVARQRGRLEAMAGGSEAVRALEAGRSSSDVELVLAVATGFWRAGEMEKSLALLDHAVELAPKIAGVRLNRGAVLQAMGRLAEAAGDYEEAISIEPTLAEARFNLGVLSEERGEYVLALSHYSAALKVNPRMAGALNNIGVLYLKVGQREKALDCFRRAVEFDSRFVPARLNLAWTYLALDQTDKALEELRTYGQAVPKEKRDPSAVRVLQELEGKRDGGGAGPSSKAGTPEDKPAEEKVAARVAFARSEFGEALRLVKEEKYADASAIVRLLLMSYSDTPVAEGATILNREIAERLAVQNADLRRRLGQSEK